MNEKKIEITVSPLGSTTIKTSGFTGMSCKDATRELERALGVASNETLTPEFHAGTQTGEQIRQGNS